MRFRRLRTNILYLAIAALLGGGLVFGQANRGAPLAAVTDDFDGQKRADPPDIGTDQRSSRSRANR